MDKGDSAMLKLLEDAAVSQPDARCYRRLHLCVPDAAPPYVLCEDNERPAECQFAEKFLQVFWNEQRLRGPLVLTDGRALEVLSPGTWNVEPGPDFRGAALRIGGAEVRGDVEIHRTPADWRRHGHDGDPSYRGVVLHVVWRAAGGEDVPGLPCFELARHLEQPWHDLARELQAAVYPYAKRVAPGACAFRLAGGSDESLRRLLAAAGTARFMEKAERICRRGVVSGFDQALYEEVFAALGYKANQEAMRRLAAHLPLAELARLPDCAAREAAFLGAAGLLPDPSRERVRAVWRPHLAGWWDAWWRLGRPAAGVAWAKAPLRPANRPEQRILAGLLWLGRTSHEPGRWCLARVREAADGRGLLRRLWHEMEISGGWGGVPAGKSRLLGRSRAGDILANVLLPFAYGACRHAGDEPGAARALEAFLQLPVLQPNRRLAEAAHRLLVPPSRIRDVVSRAVEQQGLLEIHRDFCQTAGDCGRCPFGHALAVQG